MSYLKKLRRQCRLTQQELGKLLYVSQDTISLWERGKSRPRSMYLPGLARIFDVSVEELLAAEEPRER
jgi:transcriptional regulator, cro/CI family